MNAGAMWVVDLSWDGALKQNNLGPGERETAGFGIFNATITSAPLPVGRAILRVEGGVQNFFDKLYEEHLSTLRGIVHSEPGRNFFLTAGVTVQ